MWMSPTYLDWWQWMLAALACWGLTWFLVSVTRREDGSGGLATFLGWTGGLIGAYCGGVGILQLVRFAMDFSNR
jgi:hypothetical protein